MGDSRRHELPLAKLQSMKPMITWEIHMQQECVHSVSVHMIYRLLLLVVSPAAPHLLPTFQSRAISPRLWVSKRQAFGTLESRRGTFIIVILNSPREGNFPPKHPLHPKKLFSLRSCEAGESLSRHPLLLIRLFFPSH